ncbi:mercury(II) reductase [Planococcus antarcticus DSM 14505]|uniref:Mercuric reductase n=1 Tax=Planococcus antarcticus DSM 14505 TaxID=1185653 RepID=A0ABN4RFU0_9BACL|nr:mercury(II) reductase [Planococcus antarcticus]ANU10889.1 mercury(II) reductase [Planococcus antarcticus DSM 14505]
MKKYQMEIQGMTCSECEEHIAKALKGIGAKEIQADFRKGKAVFELSTNTEVETAKSAIAEAKYQPGKAEEILEQKTMQPGNKDAFDYIIVGSGGAAFSSAIEAVKHGAKVAMIERGIVGGTCVNIGCVPSKTLLRAGEINHLAGNNLFAGLRTTSNKVNMGQLINQKDELVTELRNKKYIDLIDDYGFELIKGEAKFVDGNTVEVNGTKLSATRFLIATGASPALPAIPGLEKVDYLTSTTLLELKQVPKRLTVIGSGYIGVELGQLFHHLGAEVTLIQRSSRLFKEYDPEISEVLTKSLNEQGIHVVTDITYDRIEQDGNLKQVHVVEKGIQRVIESEELLLATGRTPNTENLNLRVANVETGSRGEIRIDEYARTTNEQIYAAGDVTLGPQFVYVAAYQGRMAAGNAVGGRNVKIDLTTVPGVTFSSPSVATVGLTEQQAKEKGFAVITSVLPLEAVPRAQVNHEAIGVFKLVADAKTRKLLGGHIVANNAGDIIYAVTLAVKFGLTIENLSETLTPYLTMAEGVKLAALTFDKDVSQLSCCAG